MRCLSPLFATGLVAATPPGVGGERARPVTAGEGGSSAQVNARAASSRRNVRPSWGVPALLTGRDVAAGAGPNALPASRLTGLALQCFDESSMDAARVAGGRGAFARVGVR